MTSDADASDLHDDDALLAQLGLALDAAERVPEDAVAVATAVFGLGRADAALADLVFDSLLSEAPVLMRGTDVVQEDRTLSFAVGDRRIDVELSLGSATLLGQLLPGEAAHVQLESTDRTLETDTDELGRFRFEARRGVLRLSVRPAEGPPVMTPWIVW
jgi:hypothetical protein